MGAGSADPIATDSNRSCRNARKYPRTNKSAIHFHMLFLDGVYEVRPPHGTRPRFQWVREPTSAQLTQMAHTIARRVGRLLEREGLLERDTEQLDLGEALDTDDPIPDLVGHSITYRIAVGRHRGRSVCH